MTSTPPAGTTTVPAPGPPFLRPGQRLLLAEVDVEGGRWTTGRVQSWRRAIGHPDTGSSTAKRDLKHLARHGYLDAHGPDDDRYYTLRSSS